MAWVINLTVGQAIYEGYRERDNARLYQDGNRNYPTDSDIQYFLYKHHSFLSTQQTNNLVY